MSLSDLMRQRAKDSCVRHLRNNIEERASLGNLEYYHYGDLTQVELDWLAEEGFSYTKYKNRIGNAEYTISW